MPAYFFAPDNTPRWRAYKTYHVLASPVIVIALVIFTIALIAQAGLLILFSNQLLVAGLLITSGVTGLLLLIFAFAVTYLPHAYPAVVSRNNLKDETHDLTSPASFSLLALLRHLPLNEEAALPHLVEILVRSGTGLRQLRRLQLDPAKTSEVIQLLVLPQLTWPQYIRGILDIVRELGAPEATIEHALAALLTHSALRSFLRERNLQEQDIGFVTWWHTFVRSARQQTQRWWAKQRLLFISGLGMSWTSGFTPLVDQFNRLPKGNLWDQYILGRESAVDQLITTLARQQQSNVLLVGQPGVGRLGVAKEMARRVRGGQAHPALIGQRVVYLHIGELLGMSNTNAGQLSIVSRVLNEMEKAGNIIAVIDGMSSILGKGEGARLNLTEVLLPFFSSLSVRVVVILSSDEYHLRLKTNEELIHFFEVVQISPATEEATLQLLAVAGGQIERRRGVYLPYRTLRALVEGTSGILQYIPFPERAFDILEEAIVTAQGQRVTEITDEQINHLLTRKVGVPIGQMADREREYLLNLESIMHRRLINQNHAVAAVARAMIRARAGVRNRHRPIGTFLFLGPTGVGKTETAKTLTEAYFGSEDYLTRLDMTEFQSEEAVAELIGSNARPVGRLTEQISDRPFTVLLLDEFEKAHAAVQQLFLQVLDEGWLTDIRGHQVSFRHAIIIATSNAGAQYIHKAVGRGSLPAGFDKQLQDYILEKNIFKPELLNRFDGVITFTPLTPEHVGQITRLMLRRLNKQLDSSHGVTVAETDELISYLVAHGYNAQLGARPMNRLIQNTVEYVVAQKILQGHIQPGQQIFLSPEQLQQIPNT